MDADDDKLAVLLRPVAKHDKGDERVRRPLLEELRIDVVAPELVRRPADEVARDGRQLDLVVEVVIGDGGSLRGSALRLDPVGGEWARCGGEECHMFCVDSRLFGRRKSHCASFSSQL